MMLLWIIALIFLALLGIYIVFIIISFWKRRIRRGIILLGIPVLLFCIFISGYYIYNEIRFRKELYGIFGTEVNLSSPIYEYHSPRAFNGDGYSLEVYTLPESIVQKFSSFSGRSPDFIPIRPSIRNHWSTVPWQVTPFEKQYRNYIDFALPPFFSDNTTLTEVSKNIESAIRKPGGFYCFFYFAHSSFLGDIDFFFIDLVDKKLYLINNNT